MGCSLTKLLLGDVKFGGILDVLVSLSGKCADVDLRKFSKHKVLPP